MNDIKIHDFSEREISYYDHRKDFFVLKNGEEFSREFVEDRRWFTDKQFRKENYDRLPWWRKLFRSRPI